MKQQQSSVVAIDLGSNSFHLLQASLDASGELLPVTALARKVQLALDMDNDTMTDAAICRGLECLREFEPYCRGLASGAVRVVGTQALRVARNRQQFIDAAADILHHPVAVISGEEEARLAYYGVAAQPCAGKALMVADIGGASTELIAGHDTKIDNLASLEIGCVSWLQYFPNGAISAAGFEQAREAATDVFAQVAAQFKGDWQVTGCSGTLLAVAEVLRQNGWAGGEIHREGLARLQRDLLQFEQIDAVRFQGLLENRRNIFASGVAIVCALFDALSLESMVVSDYGLREGIAWQLLQQ